MKIIGKTTVNNMSNMIDEESITKRTFIISSLGWK